MGYAMLILVGYALVTAWLLWHKKWCWTVTWFVLIFLLSWFFFTPPGQPLLFAQRCCAPQCTPGATSWTAVMALIPSSTQEFLIFPESCCAIDLAENPAVLERWQEKVALHTKIIIGAVRHEANQRHTSLMVIKNGRIEGYFDKNQLLPVAEYAPSAWKCMGFACLPNPPAPGSQSRIKSCFTPFVPYICGELFLQHSLVNAPDGIILCCAHDGWVRGTAAPLLMYLRACLHAILDARMVLYCSYEWAGLADGWGRVYSLLGR